MKKLYKDPTSAEKEPWFDYATYMTNKLHSLQETDPSFSANAMFAAFSEKGFGGTDGALKHFVRYGADEDVSPNEYFDPEYYYRAKAINYYTTVGGLTKEQVLENIDKYALNIKGAINNAGMNAWTHYIRYGTKEGINPSNDFDTSAYMEAKFQALKDAGLDYTMDDMYRAFAENGLNALSHYYKYGGLDKDYEVKDGVSADGKISDAYKVTGDEIIDVAGSSFKLTTGIDEWQGTNTNESITGITGGTDADTYTAADQLKDPSQNDHDVLNLYVSRAEDGGSSDVVSMTNIEQINISHTQKGVSFTADLSDVTGTQEISSRVGTGSEIILDNIQSLDTAVALTGSGNLTANYDEAVLQGEDDTVSLSLDSAGIKTADKFSKASTVDISNGGQVEHVAVSGSGTNYVILNTGLAKDITVTGTATNNIRIDSDAQAITVSMGEAEGVQTVDFSLQNRDETVTGSAQNDTFIFGSRLNANDSIDGGEGEDIVRAEMTTSVGSMKGVETIEITSVSKSMSFDGSNIEDLTSLIVRDEGANAVFKEMNAELAKLSLQTATSPSKTTISYRLDEENHTVVAKTLDVVVGQDNASGTGAGQTFGDFVIQNVEMATITSFADADNTATLTNVLGSVSTGRVESLGIATSNLASLNAEDLSISGMKKLDLTAVDKTTLSVDNIKNTDGLTDYTITAGENSVVYVGGEPIAADHLSNVNISVGQNGVIDHHASITALSLSNVSIALDELVTVRTNTLSSIETESSLNSYSFTSGMLANDVNLGTIQTSSIGDIAVTIGHQASHGVQQNVIAKNIENVSLTAGDKGFITETVTGEQSGSIRHMDISGNGAISVTAKEYGSIESINATDMKGSFTLDLSGLQPKEAMEEKDKPITEITLGTGINTITGKDGNIETYSFNTSAHAANSIQAFLGSEDKLDFATILGNNTPTVIGGNAQKDSFEELSGNTGSDVVSLIDTIFFAGDDIANILDIMDGYSLQAGSHAVAFSGTNTGGETLTAYLLTGNSNNTISSESDMAQIGTVGIESAISEDSFIAS